MLHEFPAETAEAIRRSLPEDLLAQVDAGVFAPTRGSGGRHWAPEDGGARAATSVLPEQRSGA
jgi:phospholipid/cholesterol/gamma-HCH transport system ATP-binding protein